MKKAPRAKLIIMSAAVSDYRPVNYSSRKIKKKRRQLTVSLIPTRDILKELGRRKKPGQILVGFAAETDHLPQNALKKLRSKSLDFIVANRVGLKKMGFESDSNRILILSSQGKRIYLPFMSKRSAASSLLDFVSNFSK